MIDLLISLLGSGATVDQVLPLAGALVGILFAVFIDLIYRIFSHFWR